VHAARLADELSQRERALRRLPLPYSLVLRLRDAGVSADVICQYVNVELAALDGLYRMAEAKLLAAQNVADDRYHGCRCGSRAHHVKVAEFGSTGAAHLSNCGRLSPQWSGRAISRGPRPRLGSTAPKPGELQ
jgi:hypothetical protein